MMSTVDILIEEVKQAPDAMLEEVLDFVQFLKLKRFLPSENTVQSSWNDDIEVICDKPRTIADLANEQRAFLKSITVPLIDVELPSEV